MREAAKLMDELNGRLVERGEIWVLRASKRWFAFKFWDKEDAMGLYVDFGADVRLGLVGGGWTIWNGDKCGRSKGLIWSNLAPAWTKPKLSGSSWWELRVEPHTSTIFFCLKAPENAGDGGFRSPAEILHFRTFSSLYYVTWLFLLIYRYIFFLLVMSI